MTAGELFTISVFLNLKTLFDRYRIVINLVHLKITKYIGSRIIEMFS